MGGYGRKELSLHSDIDILILFGSKIPSSAKGLTEDILYPLWDVGLELGYGTRTIKDCLRLSKDDFEVLTSMMDARFLCGDSPLFLDLMANLQKKFVSKRKTVFGRWLEDLYQIRMDTNGDASSVLEPNLKEGIGGLRDYHHILWIAKAFFSLMAPRDLEYSGKLSHKEYLGMRNYLRFIWLARNHLHQLSGRRNDRLDFEYQEKIRKHPLSSFPRTRESREINPAAGVTALETFYEFIKIVIAKNFVKILKWKDGFPAFASLQTGFQAR